MSTNAVLALAILATGTEAASFPLPRGLEPNVDFWERVYAEWNSDQVVFHDDQYLDLVYRVVDLGEHGPHRRGSNRVARNEIIRKARAEVVASLRSLERKRKRRRIRPGKLTKNEREIYEVFRAQKRLGRLAGAPGRLRWQYGLADRFAGGLTRYDRYADAMSKIFSDQGLPTDLVALSFVESLFDPTVRSRVGALGIFQMMPATGRELGLGRTKIYDERRDPFRSARAAAKMLGNNHRLLGNWPLAITGYNHGPNGVKRAVKKVRSSQLMTLIRKYRSATWGFASTNFYAEFLAARRVLAHRNEWFGDWVTSPPLKIRTVALPHSVSVRALIRRRCLTREDVEVRNLGLYASAIRSNTRLPKGFEINIRGDEEPERFEKCAASAALRSVR